MRKDPPAPVNGDVAISIDPAGITNHDATSLIMQPAAASLQCCNSDAHENLLEAGVSDHPPPPHLDCPFGQTHPHECLPDQTPPPPIVKPCKYLFQFALVCFAASISGIFQGVITKHTFICLCVSSIASLLHMALSLSLGHNHLRYVKSRSSVAIFCTLFPIMVSPLSILLALFFLPQPPP
ncbi:hypothetical protein GOP47_0009894 [Adiantum capillus-veneris]|uniref:Uncharacterized protein n=1 Tax=Adiantum capillus-veneris TaxID=13818 RepID=A0A9D4ZHJ9_ADICA|nr:hypothetical protein GOP47_0009894 [Adiantum capillus-veneris]